MPNDVSDDLMRRIQKWCFGGDGTKLGQIDYIPSIAAMLHIGDSAYIVTPAARECEDEARNLCLMNGLRPLKSSDSLPLLAVVKAEQGDLWNKIVRDFQHVGECD